MDNAAKEIENTDMYGVDTDAPIKGDDLSDLSDIPAKIWPQTLSDLVAVLADQLKNQTNFKDNPDQAEKVAQGLVMAMATYYGGRVFYLPKGDALKAGLRDLNIWKDYNGHNIAELLKKYDLSFVRIYKIISEQRALEKKRTQIDMFD